MSRVLRARVPGFVVAKHGARARKMHATTTAGAAAVAEKSDIQKHEKS